MTSTSTRPVLGVRLAMAGAIFYLGLVVVVPLASILMRATSLGPRAWFSALATPRVYAALRLSFSTALAAAILDAIFGFLVAWALTRYEFPGRRWLDALVDLPLGIPTAISGIALTSLYSTHGWVGRLLQPLGISLSFSAGGIIVALTFVGLPFVVRAVQPVLEGAEMEVEEAAASLGAGRLHILWKVVFPPVAPALAAGFGQAFARGLGEYGSVVFISGNLPFRTEIAPLLVVAKLEQYDVAGASAMASVMLAASLVLLCILQHWTERTTNSKGRTMPEDGARGETSGASRFDRTPFHGGVTP